MRSTTVDLAREHASMRIWKKTLDFSFAPHHGFLYGVMAGEDTMLWRERNLMGSSLVLARSGSGICFKVFGRRSQLMPFTTPLSTTRTIEKLYVWNIETTNNYKSELHIFDSTKKVNGRVTHQFVIVVKMKKGKRLMAFPIHVHFQSMLCSFSSKLLKKLIEIWRQCHHCFKGTSKQSQAQYHTTFYNLQTVGSMLVVGFLGRAQSYC
jgi:hypothetical protein